MGLLGLGVLVAVALVIGVAAQFLTKGSIRYEWLVVAVAMTFGGYFASESFPGSNVFSGIKDWGPQLDGLVLIPAVIGAVVFGLVADLGMRNLPEIQPA